ncbi:MAG: aldo/keto reductase [Acidobacteriota bacterium]
MNRNFDRRSFLRGSLAASALGAAAVATGAAGAQVPSHPIPKRPLGKTGHEVTILGLGGLYTLARHDKHEKAVAIINRAIDLGINYLDTAAWYGTGASELNLGTVLKERRNEVFLASKSHDYTYDGTMALVEQTLRRLQTHHLDLYQHHFLGRLGTLDQLRQENSARKAFERLRDEKTIRFIGVTGHSAKVLAEALEDYPYDTALITLNAAGEVMDDREHLDRFFEVAQEKQVGVIAMKVFARGTLTQQGYTASQLLHHVWKHPVSTAIVGISELAHLEENVAIAREYGTAMS